MNKFMLAWTHSNLNSWMHKATQETVPIDKKLDLIMFSLADMCQAIGFDDYDQLDAYKREHDIP
jgi:hypothetical protein